MSLAVSPLHLPLALNLSKGHSHGRLIAASRWFLPGLVFFAALAFKAPEFFLPMGEDLGLFSYVGGLLLRGGMVYRDVWETKPPTEYLFHAAVLAVLAEPWTTCWLGTYATTCGQVLLHTVDLLYSCAIALAIYAVGRWFLRPSFAWVAALLGVVHANAVMLSQEGSIPEKHVLLPMTLAMWAYLRWRASVQGSRSERHADKVAQGLVLRPDVTAAHAGDKPPRYRSEIRSSSWLLLAGVLAGVAASFKQPALMVALALCAHLLISDSRGPMARLLWRLVLFGCGGALAFAAILLYLLAHGVLADFWRQVVTFNVEQAGSNVDRLAGAVANKTGRVFSQSSALLWLLAALGASLLLVRSHRGGLGTRVPALVLGLWAAASVLAVYWGGAKVVQSYFLYVVPSFALLGGYALQRLWDAARVPISPRLPARGTMLLRSSLVLACLVGLMLSSGFQRRVAMRVWNDRLAIPSTITMEEWLARDLPPRTSLFIWGGSTQVHVLTRSRPASRYLHAAWLSKHHASDPSYLDRRRETMRSLLREPPEIILIAPTTSANDPEGTEALNINTFQELALLLDRFYYRVPLNRSEGWSRYNLLLLSRYDEEQLRE